MVALRMIGYEDEPTRSAEICICEIFGRDVDSRRDGHPPVRGFCDHGRVAAETVGIDARGSHTYPAEWTPVDVAFYVDKRLIKVVRHSPG